jgi:hypothetical protein
MHHSCALLIVMILYSCSYIYIYIYIIMYNVYSIIINHVLTEPLHIFYCSILLLILLFLMNRPMSQHGRYQSQPQSQPQSEPESEPERRRSLFLSRLQQLRQDLSQPPYTFSGQVPHLALRGKKNSKLERCSNSVIGNSDRHESRCTHNSFDLPTQSSPFQHSVLSGFRSQDQLLDQTPPPPPPHTIDITEVITKVPLAVKLKPPSSVITVSSASDFVVKERDETQHGVATDYHKALQENAQEILSKRVVFTVSNVCSGEELAARRGVRRVCGCSHLTNASRASVSES